jgi:CubicO group peptidase (beta-lactamase class C family)
VTVSSLIDPRSSDVRALISGSPAEFRLREPLRFDPGTRRSYGSGSQILGEVLHRSTGMTVDEFSQEYLFKRLDIREFEWSYHDRSSGVVDTGGGLKLKPRDLLKIGQMVLDRGVWASNRIVSAEWLEKSVTSYCEFAGSWQQGLQWNILMVEVPGSDDGIVCWLASGWGGQYLAIYPDAGVVAVTTGGSNNDFRNPGDGRKDFAAGGCMIFSCQRRLPQMSTAHLQTEIRQAK